MQEPEDKHEDDDEMKKEKVRGRVYQNVDHGNNQITVGKDLLLMRLNIIHGDRKYE
jgi:hypothetical protein